MPALLFPDADLLRRALAGGTVSPAVCRGPARGRVDGAGGVWVEPADPLPAALVDRLARIGVRERPPSEPLPELHHGWAELLPLRRADDRPTGLVLVELPAHKLARVARSLRRRSGRPVGVALVPDDESARAWLTTQVPPDDEPAFEAFAEAAPGVWVAAGWDHPLPHLLVPPPGGCLLLRPPRILSPYPTAPPGPHDGEYPVPARSCDTAPAARRPVIRQRLTLVPTAAAAREALWVWPAGDGDPFAAFARTAGERELRGLDAAAAGGRVILRRAAGRESAPVPVADRGYVPHPRAPGLYLPAGYELRPATRTGALARLFDLGPDRITWVERGPVGEPVAFAVPVAAFRPLTSLIEHTVEPVVRLVDERPAFDPFVLDPLPLPVVVAPEPAGVGPPAEVARPDGAAPGLSWLSRSLGRLANRLARPPAPPPKSPPLRPKPADRPARPEPRTPEELVHGPDPVARRHRLEDRLVAADPAARPALWADLAAAYRPAGMADDAALCWANALWEAGPSPAWADQWHQAECRAAGLAPSAEVPDDAPARVVAASVYRSALHGTAVSDLPAVRATLDAGADDLPVRAAWLAAGAVARLGGGDALALALWRDRLLARLDARGPGLDLDAPSFLRFHGAADPDRFRAARAWLLRARKPVLGWVGRLGKPGRLQWAGLDAETGCTAAYAQLLLAWGLAALGERSRSRDWAARAQKLLTRASAPGADPGVHAVLAGALAARVRDAREGRPVAPGLPAEVLSRYERLPEFGRYAVDKFRRFSRVLEPADRVRDYGGREFGALWGADRLGDRLALLTGAGGEPVGADEARRLLAEAAHDPGDALPRTVFALLERARQLTPGVLAELLAAVPAALDGVGRWVDAGRAATEAAALRPAVLARLVENALAAAAAAVPRPGTAAPLAAELVRRAAHDPDLRTALTRAAGPVFRSFQTLDLRDEATDLVHLLDPDRGVWPQDAPLPPHRLGLAAGWFAVGDPEPGARLLDDARGRLFVSRDGDDRDRTELAVAYAEALGWAPAGLALGRLEELFQLLDRVAVTGSTNRYYTLQPLRIVDRAVRAVVGDDAGPGPAVRAWLADDEFVTRRRIHRDTAAALRAAGLS